MTDVTEPQERAAEFSTVDDREQTLLGTAPSLTFAEFAAKAGFGTEVARTFWRTMGLPMPSENDAVFTEADVDALIQMVEISRYGVLSEHTTMSLLRALAHTGERLAWWQVEALVDDVSRRHELDDVSARLVVLDHVAEMADIFEEQGKYVWRRHLAAVVRRIGSDVVRVQNRAPAGPRSLPLTRAVGFADLVQFTQLTNALGAAELSDLVQRFEWTARDVVAANGGRVVKMIGDAVMFVADSPVQGAWVALRLAEEIGADGALPQARASVVWGRILARFGDIFGPPANLASRLTAQAEPGTVLIDPGTAGELADEPGFVFEQLPERDINGIGRVAPLRLGRSA